MYKLLLGFTVIYDVYRSFIPYKTTVTKYCLTKWISKLPGAVLGKCHESDGHRRRKRPSQFSQVSGKHIVLIYSAVILYGLDVKRSHSIFPVSMITLRYETGE